MVKEKCNFIFIKSFIVVFILILFRVARRYDCVPADTVESVHYIAKDPGNRDHYWVVRNSDTMLWHEAYLDNETGSEGILY